MLRQKALMITQLPNIIKFLKTFITIFLRVISRDISLTLTSSLRSATMIIRDIMDILSMKRKSRTFTPFLLRNSSQNNPRTHSYLLSLRFNRLLWKEDTIRFKLERLHLSAWILYSGVWRTLSWISKMQMIWSPGFKLPFNQLVKTINSSLILTFMQENITLRQMICLTVVNLKPSLKRTTQLSLETSWSPIRTKFCLSKELTLILETSDLNGELLLECGMLEMPIMHFSQLLQSVLCLEIILDLQLLTMLMVRLRMLSLHF